MGYLVSIEGIDGSGKSSAVKELKKLLQQRGIACHSTFEPTNSSPYGKRLRAHKEKRLSAIEELSLFTLDRAYHVEKIISYYLKKNYVVITDRYYFSSAVYQGVRLQGISSLSDTIKQIITWSKTIAPEPDLLAHLEIEPEKALERMRAQRKTLDAFEDLESLKRHHKAFRIARLFQEKELLVLDTGTLSCEIVAQKIFVRILSDNNLIDSH